MAPLLLVGLLVDATDRSAVDSTFEAVAAIATCQTRIEPRVEVIAPLEPSPPTPAEFTPAAEEVAGAREWLDAEFGEHLEHSAHLMRAWLVQLAKNPPPATTRVSYWKARTDLGLADDAWAGTAWSKLLGNFYVKTGVRLLERHSRPVRNGRQDTTYTVNPRGAAILRAGVDAE
jgi:hypothetical protein